MLLREKNRVLRAAATRGNDRKRRAFSQFVILVRVAAAREESRSFFRSFETAGEKIDGLDQGSISFRCHLRKGIFVLPAFLRESVFIRISELRHRPLH